MFFAVGIFYDRIAVRQANSGKLCRRGALPRRSARKQGTFFRVISPIASLIKSQVLTHIAVRAFHTASESNTHKVKYYSGAFLRICNLGAIKFGSLRLTVASEILLSRPSAFPMKYISLFKALFVG